MPQNWRFLPSDTDTMTVSRVRLSPKLKTWFRSARARPERISQSDIARWRS